MGTLQGVPCLGVPWGSASRPLGLFCQWGRLLADPWAWGGSLCPPLVRQGVFLPRFLGFFGVFLKHRHRIDVILEPLRSSFRYGRSGLCFVQFEFRLVIQMRQNVKNDREKV